MNFDDWVYNDEFKLNDLNTDYERAEYLQDILISQATGEEESDEHYKKLRKKFFNDKNTKKLLPDFVRAKRNLNQFWNYIQPKFKTYAERREHICEKFNPLLSYLEESEELPHNEIIKKKLSSFTSGSIKNYWQIAIKNINEDPENAITKARTVLESVCKHILDDLKVEYKNDGNLKKLYNKVSIELKLSPGQYNEKIFQQILSGGYSIVHGLSALRNDLSDSHGKSKTSYKPSPRHAEFAVNIAGSLALFLINTYEFNKE